MLTSTSCALRPSTGSPCVLDSTFTINEFVRDALLKGETGDLRPPILASILPCEDIARAVLFVLESDHEQISGKIFNVGSNQENYQKQMIAEEVARQIPVNIVYVDKDEDPRDYRVSFDRIGALGFRTQRRLADGINEIAHAIRDGLILDPYAVVIAIGEV